MPFLSALEVVFDNLLYKSTFTYYYVVQVMWSKLNILIVFYFISVACRIDANVDDAHISIEAAHTELVKYFQSVTSNRWLMIKIFGILILFFIIFVVFIV